MVSFLTGFPGQAARLGAVALLVAFGAGEALGNPNVWRSEWPNTDFAKHSINLGEILSGGPPKDGIPSIDAPEFVKVSTAEDLAPREPVIGLTVNGESRAYPLRILTWHEIVNDEIGGVPVAVTYCPLCNAAIVFDRRVEGQVLEFGTTGKLRRSDLVMYDRTTESWWQQFLGEAIVGELTGTKLDMLPARLEAWERFAARHPDGLVLVPNNPNMRRYGANPYVGYDSAARPFLYIGDYPEGIEPMAYVVAVGEQAWSLDLLRERGQVESGDLVLTWEAGKSSALDSRAIAEGRDIGNVVVQKKGEDVVYDLTFAFVFHAFRPDGTIHK
ncbi:MAG: DUF3179 domain-containing protein [Kiloniellales bacterium]|nr:DUF3179 domain-containing protein [Kiloniellales bacterium]